MTSELNMNTGPQGPTLRVGVPETSWVRSTMYDGFFMMSGLWAMPVVIALYGSGYLSRFHLALGVLFWIGHRVATTYLAFCQQAYRELIVDQNARFVLVPAAVIVSVFALLLIPESIIPIPVLNRVILLAVIDFAWEFYHFTMQHYGVLSVYRMLAKQNPADVAQKRLEKWYCMAAFGCGIPVSVVYHSLGSLAHANPDFIVPVSVLQMLRIAGIALVLGLTWYMLMTELRNADASVPKMLYITSVGVPVSLAFFYDSLVPALLVIAVQHWLVAVGLSAHMASGQAADTKEPNGWYRFWGVFNRSPYAVLVLMCIFSAALAPIMEFSDVERRFALKELRSMFDSGAGTREYIYWGETYMRWLSRFNRDTVLIVFVAAGFSFGYVHYLMDRAVFRFSDAATRQRGIPLLVQKGGKN